MSLRLRLLIALIPLFIIGLIAADSGTYAALESYLVSRLDEQLVAVHHVVEDSLLHQDGGPGSPTRRGDLAAVPFGTYGELRSPTGTVLLQTDTTTHPVLPAALTIGPTPSLITTPGVGAVRRYRVYVDGARDGGGGTIVTALPLADVDTTLDRLLVLELLISGGVTVVLATVTWVIVRRSLRPLERIGDTARSIAETGLGQRVEPANDRTEVGRLGLALNTMLTRIEASFAARQRSEDRLRRFVSDTSHELRTPLTSMRGYAELYRRNPGMERADIAISLQRIEDEARRMGMLVDDLLLLARLDQGRPLDQGSVDLEALITDTCTDARATDPTRIITARVAAPLVARGDDQRLRQVMGNLLRNALVHTPTGTPVEVTLHREVDSAIVIVADHGPGIPADQRAQIFERFHRADPERSRDQGGSGLGLSIVDGVVAAHGGTVSVSETPGGGATFRIALPLVQTGEGEGTE